ncbi:MAG: large subunit ribosomal protein L34e [Candidatus Woesearchaeota archaeon]|jgi:large subunit ribosomal protein L34e
MVSGKTKNHTFRKIFVRTPGGRVTIHRRLRKPSRATCPATGEKLQGVQALRPGKIGAKSTRRPSRAFGGALSSKASRQILVDVARSL